VKIHQLLSGFADGDAISREAREISAALRISGYECGIYAPAESIGHTLTGQCLPMERMQADPDDIVLFHYSIDSSASEAYFAAKCRKVVRYHNITPAEYFLGFDDAVAAQLDKARHSLRAVVDKADRVVCVSEYNALEVRELGAPNVEVVYLLDEYFRKPCSGLPPQVQVPDRRLKNILYVGRIAPNKSIEELITAFGYYHNGINRESRLLIVGSDRSCPKYYAVLKFLAARLELQNVTFCGFLDDASLAEYYKAADLLVCTSRHEGYCQPLIEAMIADVPVLARNCGGMTEAMDGAGVLYNDLPLQLLAELMDKMISDLVFKAEVLKAQKVRVDRLKVRDLKSDCLRMVGLK